MDLDIPVVRREQLLIEPDGLGMVARARRSHGTVEHRFLLDAEEVEAFAQRIDDRDRHLPVPAQFSARPLRIAGRSQRHAEMVMDDAALRLCGRYRLQDLGSAGRIAPLEGHPPEAETGRRTLGPS